jgi:hypothetical protein
LADVDLLSSLRVEATDSGCFTSLRRSIATRRLEASDQIAHIEISDPAKDASGTTDQDICGNNRKNRHDARPTPRRPELAFEFRTNRCQSASKMKFTRSLESAGVHGLPEDVVGAFRHDAHHPDFGCAAGCATAIQTNRSHHLRVAGRLTLARGFRLLEGCLL